MIMCAQEEFAKSRTDLGYLRKKRVSIEEQRRKLLQQDDYDIDKLESYVAELRNLDRQIRKKQKEVINVLSKRKQGIQRFCRGECMGNHEVLSQLGKGIPTASEPTNIPLPPVEDINRHIELKHNYRCYDQYGHFKDDFTGEIVCCPKCGRKLLLRYDYESDTAHIVCGGSFAGVCTYTANVLLKTPRCERCGTYTVLRTDYSGGQLFLGCPTCIEKGIKHRQFIVNLLFSDI